MPNFNNYTFDRQLKIGAQGVNEITDFLNEWKDTIGKVINVENNPEYQDKDIDLIWNYTKDNQTFSKTIEVKTDTYDSPNFFFETLSNVEKGTPGCFLYSEADFLFYYYIHKNKKTLYILPFKKTREWFNLNRNIYLSRQTSTPINNSIMSEYRTEGSLVPIVDVLTQVDNIITFKKINNTFEKI